MSSSETVADLQRAIGVTADGAFGRKSRASLLAAFTNHQARVASDVELAAAAKRLGVSLRQIRAVRIVEAAGRGFDSAGMPRLLYERHRFHALTGGRFSPAPFSQSAPGGYTVDADHDGIVDSWERLCDAIATGAVDAAFQACSYGLFQVLGQWWDALRYPSPFAMAISAAHGEAEQLEMFVRYVEHFGLTDELARLSTDPRSCAPFAAAYNGAAFRKNRYDEKLAEAMR